MADVNLSAVLHKTGDLRLEDRGVPEPGNGEVQVSMEAVGICGSDVHYWTNGRIGDFIVNAPMLLGHESSGVVSKLGPGVKSLKVGDRVAMEPGVPCRKCDYCKAGRYNLCLEMQFLATPPVDGNLSRFHVHAEDLCYVLPDHVSFEEGALMEPLSVAIHACRRAGITLGHSVLVCGAGPIGLACLMTAKACGAATVCVTDISKSRLEVAQKLGASCVVHVDTKSSQDVAEKVRLALGKKPDISIECSGAEPSICAAVYATKSGGVVVQVGLGAAEITFPIVNASVREVDIRGVFRYANCYPTALAMIASGQIDVKPLVTNRFPLEKTLDAFKTAHDGAAGTIKVMIDCSRK